MRKYLQEEGLLPDSAESDLEGRRRHDQCPTFRASDASNLKLEADGWAPQL